MHITIYTSRARKGFLPSDLSHLRDFSFAVNQAAGITGLLVFDGYNFIQALEGDQSAVSAVMDRILKDPRHDNIVFFEHTETKRRQFDRWSTEYRMVDDLTDGTAFLQRVMRHVAEVQEDAIKAAFIGFAALSLRRRLVH